MQRPIARCANTAAIFYREVSDMSRLLTGKCIICQKDIILELEQSLRDKAAQWLHKYLSDRSSTPFIQDALPELTPGERDAILIPVHEACFDGEFSDDD